MNEAKFDKFLDKFIYIFLILSPFIDSVTSIFVKNINFALSPGIIIRGIFLILVIIYLKRVNKLKKLLFIFICYVILSLLYYFTNKHNLVSEVTNMFQIFYLPLLLLFFSNYNNEKINDKLMLKILLIYLNLIIIPYIFGIGFNLSESYENKVGYFGLFSFGNELSAVILLLEVMALDYVNKSKSIILKLFTYIELFICIILIGTKTLFVGTVIVIIYLLIKYIKESRIFVTNKYNKLWIIASIIFISLLVLIIPKTPMMKNIKTTLDYYEIKELKDIANIKAIDNVIFSKRLSNIKPVYKEFVNKDTTRLIYGLGKSNLLNINMIEIDILDILFSIGIFGSLVYLLMVLYVIKFNKLRNKYHFIMILMIIISILSGHILIKPMVSIYLALLFILSRNSITIDKKSILIVSNMYPSKKYKHYGSFVKNTKELLEENNYIVDKVVIGKHDNKIVKLFAYIYLHLYTILKGTINNYDYIYVHFISHSSLGPIILKKISINTKLVLNAHGNDIVSDDGNLSNIKKSKKYIKHADIVVVPSKYFKDVIVKDYKYPIDKVFVYPSGGVNTKKFKKYDKKESKKNSKLDEKYNYIGYVSRLEKDKGYDTFLKAASILIKEKEFKNYKFLVVGSGSEQNIFDNLVKELNLKDYIETKSFVSQDELISIYNSLDVFVFPTNRKSESLGLVGLEAMACETLVIAANNYGPTDYVLNNKNGLLFKPRDSKDLSNKIKEILTLSKEESSKIKKEARLTAEKYDVKNTKELILKVFK